MSDETHIAWCNQEGLVIVTFDTDFIRLHTSGATHAGIAWAPQLKFSLGGLIARLVRLASERSAEEMRDWLEYL